ncbi:SDR family NAD(P)-dependent oxidoreductase [Phytoactinopolyspora halotolerans]|uniref:SDR family oxidoreductase n=1 Tax=Phytoactinopolyspora halotolerans TaxID=1981512 RepID=A0A6L9SGC8_9ACTN|nr:SDR family oxidoreductase [Phytoactinopolyspora halotolerans]NEE04425.1 SDR family oxidoreductase [Phytoactinopolyspora halotolerans]
MPDLTGQVAFVTGGSRGIGAAIATRLAQDGADVAFTYRADKRSADETAGRIRAAGRTALAIQADSAEPHAATESVDTVVRNLGRLDILVANAGIFPNGPLDDVTLDEIDQTLAIHVRAPLLAAQAAAAHMGDGGRLIAIGSCYAERVPVPGVTLYSMTKSALTGLVKGLARDLGPRGITANVVHPGPTDTDMNPADGPDAEAERALTALGRYGTGADVAGMVAFLASQEGAWVTGASFAVDGGYAA